MQEILLYGRGGHGAVIASELIARAGYFEGKYSQAFPFFGGERRGAPVRSFARIDDKPITLHSQIYNADIIMVLDKELLKLAKEEISINMIKKNGTILFNASDKSDIEEYVKAMPDAKFAYVDAISIAQELNLVVAGWPVINTAMLGALAKASNVISIDSAKKAIADYWPKPLADKNIAAAEKGYENCNVLR
ncbi:MAG: 2-oxoacid:acceptor oxidoreductase family protein [Candidatus Micrarchaeia archaeon]